MTVNMTVIATGETFEAEEHEVAQLRPQGCKPTSELAASSSHAAPPASDGSDSAGEAESGSAGT